MLEQQCLILNPDFLEVQNDFIFQVSQACCVSGWYFALRFVPTSFTQIVSFGGGLSDTGNLFQAIGSSPPAHFNGQFSDDQVWNEILTINPGWTAPPPSLLRGTNHTWTGAKTKTAD